MRERIVATRNARRYAVVVAFLIIGLALVSRAETGAPFPNVTYRSVKLLQSAAGDRIRLIVANFPRSLIPELDRGTIPARLVDVCLRNRATNKWQKGFDNRRDQSPPYTVNPGESICVPFEPASQSIYLWSNTSAHVYRLVLVAPMNLRNARGSFVLLDWVTEGTGDKH
jgi:hypothetical protein